MFYNSIPFFVIVINYRISVFLMKSSTADKILCNGIKLVMSHFIK